MAATTTFQPAVRHGVNSKTFVAPDLDAGNILTDYYDVQYLHSPDHIFGLFHKSDGSIKRVSWRQHVRVINHAGRLLLDTLRPCLDPEPSTAAAPPSPATGRPLIGLLVSCDYYTWFCTQLGLMKSGFPICLFSPRTMEEHQFADLLQKTGCKILLVGRSERLQKFSLRVLDTLRERGQETVKLVDLPPAADLLRPIDDDNIKVDFLPPITPRPKPEDTAVIIHSPGSTGVPKPIVWTHQTIYTFMCQGLSVDVDMEPLTTSVAALPGFHCMWFFYGMMLSPLTGYKVAFLPIDDDPPMQTPDLCLQLFRDLGVNHAVIVPSFLEAWARDDSAIQTLKTFKYVGFGGGPLPHLEGRRLVDAGVNVASVYASTEAGLLTKAPSKRLLGHDYYWHHLNDVAGYELEAQNDGTGAFELIIKPKGLYKPCTVNRPEGKAFATNDLVQLHPKNPKFARIIGRADDQIHHSTGETTSPRLMEDLINQSPLVRRCIIFGHERFQTGVIIEPVLSETVDPKDESEVIQFRDKVWPAVQVSNQDAPLHSRLYKEMILVADPNKAFVTSGVRNLISRKLTLAAYADEIDALYALVEKTSDIDVTLPKDWKDKDDVRRFVGETVRKVFSDREGLRDDVNFFEYGCESLQATIIRNFIYTALRKASFPTRHLPSNPVYLAPSIEELATYISRIVASDGKLPKTRLNYLPSILAHTEAMKSMISRYSLPAQKRPPRPVDPAFVKAHPTTDTVLITGSTGALGSELLAQLVQDPYVQKIYALNRPKDGASSLERRQRDALDAAGCDPDLASSEKVVLVECNLELETLGLSESLYREVRDSVTLIIHAAWKLYFGSPLKTFETYVRGTSSLINLALSSPGTSSPTFIFPSSIAVFASWHDSREPDPPEEFIENIQAAYPSGYGESKIVAEKLIEGAVEQHGLKATVVRLGQLSGADGNGAWSVSSWVAILVKTGVNMGSLPDFPVNVSWMSTTAAARTILSIRHTSEPVLNVVHPQATPWTKIFRHMAAVFKVPLISYGEWIQQLQTKRDPERFPALNILDFFKGGLVDDSMSIEKAIAESKYLADLPPLDEKDIEKWIQYWKDVRFL